MEKFFVEGEDDANAPRGTKTVGGVAALFEQMPICVPAQRLLLAKPVCAIKSLKKSQNRLVKLCLRFLNAVGH